MKCKKCGKSFKDIKGISAHYRKEHPAAMKRKASPKIKGWKPQGEHAGMNPYQMVYSMIRDHERYYHGEK